MKKFITTDDSLPIRNFLPQVLSAPKHETRDAKLGKAVCAWIIATTPKPTFRGVRVLLRPAVE